MYAVLAMVCLGAIYLVTQGMDLINQPSDMKVAEGIGLIVLVVVLFPAAMRWIWHHKTTPHSRPIIVNAKSPAEAKATARDAEPAGPNQDSASPHTGSTTPNESSTGQPKEQEKRDAT